MKKNDSGYMPISTGLNLGTMNNNLKNQKNGYKITKEGRLNIPTEFVQKLQAKPYGKVYLEKTFDSKLIISSYYVSQNFELSISKDGRIRICKGILSEISTGDLFKITETTNVGEKNIIVSPVKI
jgi:bifunctional DNA-binding transcriptional regulator/antitoxin component of YhaV-PrlF toxin-antitoxin module